MVIGPDGTALGRGYREFTQHYPKPGWVEHDPTELWQSVIDATEESLRSAGVAPSGCKAIGITNQRETTLVWDRRNGKAVHNAIVWQDRRTAQMCDQLRDAGRQALFSERTGLVLDPYFSGTKLAWLLDHTEGARALAADGHLCFGTVDSYLIYRLSGNQVHVTDVTNASRTLLFNIHTLEWDEDLTNALNIMPTVLPQVRGCSETFAVTSGFGPLPDGIPIAGVAGDQHAALFGQRCFQQGDAKCTYGTGAFLLVNTGNAPVRSDNGLITTIGWSINGRVTYALEGSVFVAGAAVQWLRDGLGILESSAEVEALARRAPKDSEVMFVPALTGLGAPYWDAEARGVICGLTRDTTAAQIARAALEGIAHEVTDLADAMQQDAGNRFRTMRVDGGASANDLLMQMQSDLLDLAIERPACVDTTALGAAYLAGLSVGFFESQDALLGLNEITGRFTPAGSAEPRARRRTRWRDAVARTRSNQPAQGTMQ